MKDENQQSNLQDRIEDRERRKLKSQKQGKPNVWQGFGVFGLIGWSIALPLVSLTLVGIWLDERYDHEFSFTLSPIGCGTRYRMPKCMVLAKQETE